MAKFIIKSLVFILPLLAFLSYVEISNRFNNTFYAKREYIAENKDSIEVMILGSSQSWRAINPEYLDAKVAPLAHGASALNVEYLLFEKYVDKLPNLKVVLLEISYHTLEDYRDKTWPKNHLFYIYYGLNNYGGNVPLADHLLVTANHREYIRKWQHTAMFPEFGECNKYGFITSTDETLGDSLDNIENSYENESENLEAYQKNTGLLEKMIRVCQERNIEVVLLSPPKYFTYNQSNNPSKLQRRNSIFNDYGDKKGIQIWNYEHQYEYDKTLFYDDDHLNVNGAKTFTIELNGRISELMEARETKTEN